MRLVGVISRLEYDSNFVASGFQARPAAFMNNPSPDLDRQGRDRNDYARCKMCGVSALDKEVSLQPSRSALIFGSFPGMRVPMEHRCNDCEEKVCEGIDNLLNFPSLKGDKLK